LQEVYCFEMEPARNHRGSSIKTFKSYAKLAHPSGILTWSVATVVFTCIAVKGVPNPVLLTYMIIVVISSQICIGCMNDYCDRTIDAQIKPWRPIPSGEVSERSAIIVSLVSFIVVVFTGTALGVIGIIGALVGTGAGLAHNFGLKSSIFSWVPFVVGFSLLPLWIWLITGNRVTPDIIIMFFYALPLVIGLHFANQLPDIVEERNVGSRSLVHRFEPYWALRLTAILLLCAPFIMLIPVMSDISDYPHSLFVPGLLIYLSLLGYGLFIYSRGLRYHLMKRALGAIRLGTLGLISFWFMAITWS
jgi:4-hydroxybenzoate polyprenyltransferase